jgi:hypothetical protein
MKYPEIAIRALVNSLDDDEEAYTWLAESKWKELAAFADAFYSDDNSRAIEFLVQNKDKFSTIVNFFGALEKEDAAFDMLMKNDDKQWAAVVNAFYGSSDAYDWLRNNNFDVYADMADVLIKNKPTRHPIITGIH